MNPSYGLSDNGVSEQFPFIDAKLHKRVFLSPLCDLCVSRGHLLKVLFFYFDQSIAEIEPLPIIIYVYKGASSEGSIYL